MKAFFTFLATALLTTGVWAQSPLKMSYQAVIRNTSDQLVINQPIGMRISILQGSAMGVAVYTETQVTSTNSIGLVSIEIGGGAGFDVIDWTNGPYFIKTETDPEGGANYTITNASQLLSVPYALHAKTAEALSGGITETDPVFGASPAKTISGSDIANWNSKQDKLTAGNSIVINGDTISATGLPPNGTAPGEMFYWNGSAWALVPPGTNGSILSLCGNTPTWGGCIPILTTASVSGIGQTSANCGGTVISDRGFPVTGRGVCWYTSQNPTITYFFPPDSLGTGSYTCNLTDLSPNTTYFLKAFAVNSAGTAYGNEVSFTTSAINESTACYSVPDGVVSSGIYVGWSYKDYIIPEGFKVDSILMNASRPGYPQEEYDLIIGYCEGKTSYDASTATIPLDYTATASPMYNNWLALIIYDIHATGIIRVLLPTNVFAVWNELCFAISPLKYYNVCFTAPDGKNDYKWSYKDFVIPAGFRVDSINMEASRPGYKPDKYDLLIGYCPGTTSYNSSVVKYLFEYESVTTPMYNTWLDLTNKSVKGPGMIRVKLPTHERAVWNNLCVAISEMKLSVPSVRTLPVTNISYTSAKGGGEITDDGGATVTWCGVCLSTSPNPTEDNDLTFYSNQTGAFTSNLSGLNPGTLYYARAFARNSVGTAYGNELSFTTRYNGYSIGQNYGGGIIFYIDSTGQHGLIAAPFNHGTGAEWGCSETLIGTNGNGKTNTLAIVNGCSQPGIAARICYDLTLNGYDDWFLPSREEFWKMYGARNFIDGLENGQYWTSTEWNSESGTAFIMWVPESEPFGKQATLDFRAIRAF